MSREQCYPNVINDPSRVVIKHLSCHDIKTHVSSDLFVVEFSGSQPDVRFFGNCLYSSRQELAFSVQTTVATPGEWQKINQ